MAAPFPRLVARDLHQTPHEAAVVRLARERPVQAGRRDLEGVGAVDRVLGVEDGGDLFGDGLELVEADPAFLVHVEAHEMAPAFTLDLDIHEFESSTASHPLGDAADDLLCSLLLQAFSLQQKRVGASPLWCTTPSWNSKDIRAFHGTQGRNARRARGQRPHLTVIQGLGTIAPVLAATPRRAAGGAERAHGEGLSLASGGGAQPLSVTVAETGEQRPARRGRGRCRHRARPARGRRRSATGSISRTLSNIPRARLAIPRSR